MLFFLGVLMLWPMATTDYLRRTGGVPAAGWRRANSWWTHIYWEPTAPPHFCSVGMTRCTNRQ
jgi:hypothetical protein